MADFSNLRDLFSRKKGQKKEKKKVDAFKRRAASSERAQPTARELAIRKAVDKRDARKKKRDAEIAAHNKRVRGK